MAGIRSDEELASFLTASKTSADTASTSQGTAVVEYGTSWCTKCYEMFPSYYKLSKKVCGLYIPGAMLMHC